MGEMKSLILKAAGVTVLAISLILGWVFLDYQEFLSAPLKIEDEKTVLQVKKGMSIAAVAAALHKRGILGNRAYFKWHARLSGKAHKIHVGEYHIKRGATPRSFFVQLVTGDIHRNTITFIEGWTFKQMMQKINQHPDLTHELKGLKPAEIMAKIGKPGVHPEGRFYPSTYKIDKGSSDIDLLKRAYALMEKKLNAEWQKRDKNLPLKTPYQALILASVVEKETGTPSERPRIAGVFVRRLIKGMKLQSDPTVIYGMGEKYKGNIRRKDLRKDTPYNTYTRYGLPVTPIAMPSGEAIEAVLHPAPGDELYFVARGDGSGSHKFSKTLREHNNAVIKYQLKGKARPFSSYPKKKKSK